jgi:hypothetical protein
LPFGHAAASGLGESAAAFAREKSIAIARRSIGRTDAREIFDIFAQPPLTKITISRQTETSTSIF